jgi:NAD-reducing hydrogenase small subunit
MNTGPTGNGPTGNDPMNTGPNRIRLATTWLDGCSGCHMSFLDLDERLIELATVVELVYSPLVDHKEYPEQVDVCLVEGAVSSTEDLHRIRMIRERTRVLVSFGDCAVTTNVPGMRNPIGPAEILNCGYREHATRAPQLPSEVVPELLPKVLAVHQVVTVDCYLPGCPPAAELIWQVVSELVSGKPPAAASAARFGK